MLHTMRMGESPDHTTGYIVPRADDLHRVKSLFKTLRPEASAGTRGGEQRVDAETGRRKSCVARQEKVNVDVGPVLAGSVQTPKRKGLTRVSPTMCSQAATVAKALAGPGLRR